MTKEEAQTIVAATSPREVLEKTDYKLYSDEAVLKDAPIGPVEKPEFFNLGRWIDDEELEKEYAIRGLEPVNLNSLAAFCEEHHFVATHWKEADGNYCYLTFYRWSGGRDVFVKRRVSKWNGRWWFAGRRKDSTQVSENENSSDTLPSAAVATTNMDEQQKAALRYLLAYVERWNKKDEDAEAAHAQGILEDYLSGA